MKAGAGATGAAGVAMAALVFGPLPQNYDISKPRYVVGTSNGSIHFHSVAIGAARRLSRRMRVQILTHATEEDVVFLVTFPDAKARGC